MQHTYLAKRLSVSLEALPEHFNLNTAEAVVNVIQDLAAEVIAYCIDAGSERDAVNESEELHKAITAEVHSWLEPEYLEPDDQAHHNH